jgi:hypothetical protein
MKRCSAEEAAALLRPRNTMILGFGPAQPGVLLEEVDKRDDWEDLTIFGGAPAPALSDFREAEHSIVGPRDHRRRLGVANVGRDSLWRPAPGEAPLDQAARHARDQRGIG